MDFSSPGNSIEGSLYSLRQPVLSQSTILLTGSYSGSRSFPATPLFPRQSKKEILRRISTFLHLAAQTHRHLDSQSRKIPPLLRASRSGSPSSFSPLIGRQDLISVGQIHRDYSPSKRANNKTLIAILRSIRSFSVHGHFLRSFIIHRIRSCLFTGNIRSSRKASFDTNQDSFITESFVRYQSRFVLTESFVRHQSSFTHIQSSFVYHQ